MTATNSKREYRLLLLLFFLDFFVVSQCTKPSCDNRFSFSPQIKHHDTTPTHPHTTTPLHDTKTVSNSIQGLRNVTKGLGEVLELFNAQLQGMGRHFPSGGCHL